MVVVDAAVDGDVGDGGDSGSPLAVVAVPPGWTRRSGFSLPGEPWDLRDRRWMCVGAIADDESAELALEALLRGVGLLVVIEGSGRFRLQVLDDLHHNGRVERRGGGADVDGGVALGGRHRDGRPTVVLGEEDESLLAALAGGDTVETAARRGMMSPRTAQRRLAVIRRAYGAANTTEAVALWLADREGEAGT